MARYDWMRQNSQTGYCPNECADGCLLKFPPLNRNGWTTILPPAIPAAPQFAVNRPEEKTVHEASLRLSRLIRPGFDREQGQNVVEYVLIIALMALAITVCMRTAALELRNALTQVAATISNALAWH